jgi:hypothetical protein
MADGWKAPLIGALATAAVSTAGDYLWANVLPHRQPVYWFAHAIVLFLTIGVCLGAPARRPVAGALGAILIGCGATVGFYLLQPIIGYSALFVLFVLLWVALGILTGRMLQRRDRMTTVLARSALAAVGSGLAFYAISGIWMPFNPHGWDYAKHFVYWTIAYLPAFTALLSTRSVRL